MGKILILTNHSYMLYRFRLALLKTLSAQNEVVLAMPFVGHEADFAAEGFRCIEVTLSRRGMNPWKDLRLLHTYRQLLQEESPDLVIAYSIKPNVYGGMACRMARIPFCANVQGLGSAFQRPILAQLVGWMYRIGLKKAGRVFFENQENAQEFLRRKMLSASQIVVLNGAGISLEAFTCQPYPENAVFRFLYVGRIMAEKGMDALFAAVEQLQKVQMPFVLDMVGFFEEDYAQQLEQLQQQGVVEFHGFQEDPRPFYAQADCVVLPSLHEGMSNVLLEAAAMGRPLITSDIPGCRETVEDGVSGLLCRPADAQSLTEKMAQMLSLPRQKRGEMGLAGRKKMEKEFSKEQVVAQTIQALPLPKSSRASMSETQKIC